jgi:hypothetical protein
VEALGKAAEDWYDQDFTTTKDDVKRVRVRRAKDRSRSVAAHFVSSPKNVERVKRYRPDAAAGFDDLTDCDALAEYTWAIVKLRHHARKAIDYARPVIDVCETVYANLEHWQQLLDGDMDRVLKAVYDSVASADDAHDDSCGTFSKKPSRRLRITRNGANRADQAQRKSEHCYGPPPRMGQIFLHEAKSQPRFAIALKVTGKKAKQEFEDVREIAREEAAAAAPARAPSHRSPARSRVGRTAAGGSHAAGDLPAACSRACSGIEVSFPRMCDTFCVVARRAVPRSWSRSDGSYHRAGGGLVGRFRGGEGMGVNLRRLGCVLTFVMVLGVAAAGWAAPVDIIFNLPNFTNVPGNTDEAEQDEIIYQSDYVTTESVDTAIPDQKEEEAAAEEEAPKPAPGLADRLSIGVDATIIEDQQLIAIPFGYRLSTNLKLGAAVPFVRREGDKGSTFGLGDVSASIGYRWGSPLRLLGITSFIVKAPTGDPEAQDEGEFLSTGTGSWDFAFYQVFIRRFGRWRGDLTLGYRLNTEGDFDADGQDVTLENGDVLNVIVGASREIDPIPGLVGYLKVDTRFVGDAELTIEGQEADAAGSFTAVDVLPGVKYFMQAGTALRLGLRIPVNDTGARDPALDFQIVQTF